MKTDKIILDACCGSRMFWFDKTNPNVLFADIRNESHVLCDGRDLVIAPDIQIDFREMPFGDNTFKLVVFDPPHLIKLGSNSWMAKKYGKLNLAWEQDIKQGFDECVRVLQVGGTLIFKWNERDIKANDLIRAIGMQPLFGHKTRANSETIWMAFMKGL